MGKKKDTTKHTYFIIHRQFNYRYNASVVVKIFKAKLYLWLNNPVELPFSYYLL